MKSVKQFTAILVIGAVVVIATTFVVNSLRKPLVVQNTVSVPAQPPQCPEDFNSYQALVNSGQSVELVNNLSETYASGGIFMNGKDITITTSGAGQIACGYLYVKAGIDGHALDPNYDSVYISPQGLGGHLLASKTIAIPNAPTSTTQILLPLTSISYLPNLPYNPNAQNFETVNWADLLNATNKINFQIGLSTTDPRGEIDDVIIAYQCWDPSTGKPSTDCQLSVQ